jgi:hypothetical protein
MHLPMSFISRNAHEPGGIGYQIRIAAGKNPLAIPPEVAGYMVGGGESIPVTWSEIHDRRRQEQRKRLADIRYCPPRDWQPVTLWAFENPGTLFGGWWCYLTTRDGSHLGSGPKNNVAPSSDLALNLMSNIPLGIAPHPHHFDAWMQAFAAAHPKPKTQTDRRTAGLITGWSNGRTFRRCRSNPKPLRYPLP